MKFNRVISIGFASSVKCRSLQRHLFRWLKLRALRWAVEECGREHGSRRKYAHEIWEFNRRYPSNVEEGSVDLTTCPAATVDR